MFEEGQCLWFHEWPGIPFEEGLRAWLHVLVLKKSKIVYWKKSNISF